MKPTSCAMILAVGNASFASGADWNYHWTTLLKHFGARQRIAWLNQATGLRPAAQLVILAYVCCPTNYNYMCMGLMFKNTVRY
jgi:hypothetical protein